MLFFTAMFTTVRSFFMQISDDTKTEKRADGNGKTRKPCFINDAYNNEDVGFEHPKENGYKYILEL